MKRLSRFWWLGMLVAAFALLAVGCTGLQPQTQGDYDVTASDCPAMQRVVDSMAGSDADTIARAVAVQVLGVDPSAEAPGTVRWRGANALNTCDIDIPSSDYEGY